MFSRFRRRPARTDAPRDARMRRDMGLPLLAPPLVSLWFWHDHDGRR